MVQINNRLHVSDGHIYRIYDGWNWFVAGLVAPASAPTVNTSGTGLTGSYQIAVTAVHIRSNGSDVRIHESNRSPITTQALTNQGFTVNIPADLPSRATHWSIYMSEVAGSGVLRRAATHPITTTTSTAISTNPSATAATAPERNDPVLPSRVLCQWKNRVAMRSETNPDKLRFTAFGEVAGLLNGAPDECLPGSSSSSISDLVNEWQIPDGGQPIQTSVYHGEVLWVFTDRHGFYIQGEGALLDDTGLRDFKPQRGLQFGASGPDAAISTPQGLIVMSHEHKIWLWRGGEPIDIGHDIQSRLDDLTEQELNNIEMTYWSGEGWDWLVVPLADGLAVFDFALGTPGGWIGRSDLPQPTAVAIYHPGRKFLLSGHIDGSVHQLINLCQPSHLGLSCVVGNTYLNASVQDSPTSTARTGPLNQGKGQWTEMKYVQYQHRGHTDTTTITASNPTITAYYDQVNPALPDSGVALTSATVTGSNERRAYFKPTSTASAAGALAKNSHVEFKWTTTDTDGASRPQLVNNELLRIIIASQPKGELTR